MRIKVVCDVDSVDMYNDERRKAKLNIVESWEIPDEFRLNENNNFLADKI